MVAVDSATPHTEVCVTICSGVAHFQVLSVATLHRDMAVLGQISGPPNSSMRLRAAVATLKDAKARSVLDMMRLDTGLTRAGLPLEAPLALVLPEEIIEAGRLYASLQMNSGIPRGAFTSEEPANAWTAEWVARLASMQDDLRR